MHAFWIAGVFFTASVSAVRGGSISNAPISYTAGYELSKLDGTAKYPIKGVNYEYTGLGGAESSIDVEEDGTLIYSPAFSNKSVGYAISKDNGVTWSAVAPSKGQSRMQPVFNIHDGRYFFWSSSNPGLQFSYSDDKGATWKTISKHFQAEIGDWAKIVSGKPVFSQLKNGTSQILYMSAPSQLSVTVAPGLGPVTQRIVKSLDRGETWMVTKGRPTLIPAKNGGPCEAFNKDGTNDEYIIWSNGLVRPNGTVMFGLRRCRSLSIAISDDEANTWRYSDIHGSSVVPYKGLPTWVENGNVITSEPISQDKAGNLFALWVDDKYVLKMAKSADNALTWSKPIVVSAPGGRNSPVMSYHPVLIHHPSIAGRAALAHYASPDGGATWHAYIAETHNIDAEFPVFSSIVANELSQPMQKNVDGMWDQGYKNPEWDLIEFVGLRYHPKTGDLIAAFARKMCSQSFVNITTFDVKSCADGWDFENQDRSPWQGYIAFAHH